MQGLNSSGEKAQVQSALGELITLCDEAKSIYEYLFCLLPSEERNKHETWFKAKVLTNNECTAM